MEELSFDRELIGKLINISNNQMSYLLAKLIYDKHKDTFVCADTNHQVWYQFKHHKWNLVDLPMMDLSGDIIYDITRQINLYMSSVKADQSSSNDFRELNWLSNQLKTLAFRNNIMSDCKYVFFCLDFESKLEQNRHMVCFRNGVLDTSTKQFRTGQPSDYLHKSIDYDYSDIYAVDRVALGKLERYLKDTFPDTDHYTYRL